jgi:hypothetical protein
MGRIYIEHSFILDCAVIQMLCFQNKRLTWTTKLMNINIHVLVKLSEVAFQIKQDMIVTIVGVCASRLITWIRIPVSGFN